MALPYKTSGQNVIDFKVDLESTPTGVTLGDVKKAIDSTLFHIENHNLTGGSSGFGEGRGEMESHHPCPGVPTRQ